MTDRIRQLICDINAAWKPDHFVYGIREEEKNEPLMDTHVQSTPYPLRRWRMTLSERVNGMAIRQMSGGWTDPPVYSRLHLQHTKLMLGANYRRRFYITLETNALSSISFRGSSMGFFARILHFEMHSRAEQYLPLVMHIADDKSGDIQAMESFLSDLLEDLKVPTYGTSS